MKRVPNFYFKNIAQHKQKKLLSRLPEFKDLRYDISKECADIFCAILMENEASEDQVKEIIEKANEEAKKFSDRLSYSEKDVEKESGKRTSGRIYAYHQLKEDSRELMPYGFTYPLKFTPKRQKDFVQASQIREAAETTLRMYAIAAGNVMRYGQEDISKILKEVYKRVS